MNAVIGLLQSVTDPSVVFKVGEAFGDAPHLTEHKQF